ncbi:uncharacterized protein LOC143245981 [Tachypleus tridentatus]|uniref:uncharacterized protein LOC143245981 n=1 Tax=Tachypleus tridentatus TaxID=6853 RepID=UPI003FD5DDBB
MSYSDDLSWVRAGEDHTPSVCPHLEDLGGQSMDYETDWMKNSQCQHVLDQMETFTWVCHLSTMCQLPVPGGLGVGLVGGACMWRQVLVMEVTFSANIFVFTHFQSIIPTCGGLVIFLQPYDNIDAEETENLPRFYCRWKFNGFHFEPVKKFEVTETRAHINSRIVKSKSTNEHLDQYNNKHASLMEKEILDNSRDSSPEIELQETSKVVLKHLRLRINASGIKQNERALGKSQFSRFDIKSPPQIENELKDNIERKSLSRKNKDYHVTNSGNKVCPLVTEEPEDKFIRRSLMLRSSYLGDGYRIDTTFVKKNNIATERELIFGYGK